MSQRELGEGWPFGAVLIKARGLVFDPTRRPVVGCGLTAMGHMILGETAPFEGRRKIPREGIVAVSSQLS